MSRQYADQVLVRSAPALASASIGGPSGGACLAAAEAPPQEFLWRGRIYRVQAVLQHWIEAGAWWRGPAGPAGASAAAEEYDLWRVEAAAGRRAPQGQYELCRHRGTGRWFLVRAFD
jgi:hypothetical protein